MANRPVFIAKTDSIGVAEELIEFQFFNGFAISQKQKCINSLHAEFLKKHETMEVLEISSKSTEQIGVLLSAFNLKTKGKDGNVFSLENIFQSSKVFEHGGPYLDLLSVMPWEAKKDNRLKESGKLVSFCYEGTTFPLFPITFFYDWIYINALSQNEELAAGIMRYDAFTDIEYNPKKSLNCQARSAAIYVSLVKAGQLIDALASPEEFRTLVYGGIRPEGEQMSML